MKLLAEKKARLEELEHFDEIREGLQAELKTATGQLEKACASLSQIRKKAGRSWPAG